MFVVPQKYYPPDFDPSKIPKLKLPKDRQYVVRLMAPFNMRYVSFILVSILNNLHQISLCNVQQTHVMSSALPLWSYAGVKRVVSTSTRGKSSMHAKRLFRTSCTWASPSSASTSNVLDV